MGRRSLAGLPILITGASSGIGRATAIECARRGMPVALAARRQERLAEVREQITAMGVGAVAIACDVRDQDACDALVDRAESELGPLHAVFANAGFGHQLPVLPDIDAHRAQFDVNFWGSLRVIAPAAERMCARGGGHVLLCSSCLSKIGLPYYAAYCASKAAQDHFARALRHELASEGVNVSSVHPIGTKTEFFEHLQERSDGPSLVDSASERFMQPPELVARRVADCLERPRGEVWTSLPMRLGLAAAVALPGLADWAIARKARKRQASGERTADDHGR